MVVAGVAVVVAGIERLESRASRAEVARVGASAGEQSKTRLYAVGDRAAAVPGVEFRRADKTVLLYISSTCIYSRRRFGSARSKATGRSSIFR